MRPQVWSVTQQIYTTDDPTKHGKLTGLGSSVGTRLSS